MPCGQTRGNSQPAYVQTIKNSTFNNCINIRVRDPFHNGHVTDYRGFRTEVRDTVVNRPTGINCGIAYDVYMNKVPGSLVAELVVENSLYWFNWGADPDIDLRIYFKEQRDTAILDQSTFYPSGVPQKIACPSAGLTNTQCNTTHGVRFAGEIATCTDDTTRPTVFGFTCLLTGAGAPDPPPEDPPPPANQNPPTGLSIGASP
jgi:hypothetical protein